MKTNFVKYFLNLVVAGTLLLWTACKPNDTKILEDAQAKVSAVDPNIAVEVHEGVVTLSGQVMDDAVRMNAENAAKEVKGVQSVTNNVVVTPPVQEPITINNDMEITTAINSGLQAKGIAGVTVTVLNGEVTLTGNAKKSDLQTIIQIANEARPAKVNNELTLQ